MVDGAQHTYLFVRWASKRANRCSTGNHIGMSDRKHGLADLFGEDTKQVPAAPQTAGREAASAMSEPSPDGARLTIILPLPRQASLAAQTIDAIRSQTRAAQIEVIAYGPDTDSAAKALAPLDSVDAVNFVLCPSPSDEPKAIRAAMLAAKAPLVLLLDWYALPARDCTECILGYPDEKYDVLGIGTGNANPDSGESWATMLPRMLPEMMADTEDPETLLIGNTVYRKTALEAFGEGLTDAIARGSLAADLRARDFRLRLSREAQIRVLNPSLPQTVRAIAQARGRMAAIAEIEREGLGFPARLLRAAGVAFTPTRRFFASKRYFAANRDYAAHEAKNSRAVLTGFLHESLGRIKGFLLGPKDVEDVLAKTGRDLPHAVLPAEQQRFFPSLHDTPERPTE